jgi:hypothetical protein
MATLHPSRWTRWSGGVPEALLFHLVCAQEMERGEHSALGDVVLFDLETYDWPERLDFMPSGQRETSWWSRKARSQEGEGEGFRSNFRNQANLVSNQMSNSRIDENLSGKTFPVPSARSPLASPRPWPGRRWRVRACGILWSFSQLLNVVGQNSTI